MPVWFLQGRRGGKTAALEQLRKDLLSKRVRVVKPVEVIETEGFDSSEECKQLLTDGTKKG